MCCESATSHWVKTKDSVKTWNGKTLSGWFSAMASDSLRVSDRDVNGFVVLVTCPSVDFLFVKRERALVWCACVRST